MTHRFRALALLAVLALAGGPAVAHAAEDQPDLSEVTLDLDELPAGFREVNDSELQDVGGSAKQIGDQLASALDEASLQEYRVYASASGDELIELVVVGPLTDAERRGVTAELGDAQALADQLSPIVLYVDFSEPRVIDTAGIGDAAAGFALDARVSSDLAVVKNILGVQWTESTTQYVIVVRGSYLLLMASNFVGSGTAQVDFLAAVRHVDGHLAAALGLAVPGTFRPGGTFAPTIANHIPTLNDVSTDPGVVLANLVLAALAVLVLTVAMRLLNTTLVAHEDALERLLRPARTLGRWWRRADERVVRRAGRLAGALRTLGVLLFYGVLFSFLEDGWRPWTVSGLFLLAAMSVAYGVVGTTDDMVELRAAHRWGKVAELVVKPGLVLLAIGSVVLTKLASLVPGILIGTPEAFSLESEADDETELRLAKVGLGTTAAVAGVAWLAASPLDGALDGATGFGRSLMAGAVTLLVLIFAVAVENLFANLLAFPGSEGAALRRHNRVWWWVCMLVATALFFHTLINPGGDLAASLESTNVRVVMGTVGAFLVATLLVRVWFDRPGGGPHPSRVEVVPIEPTAPVEPPAALAPPTHAAVPAAAPRRAGWAPPQRAPEWSGPPPVHATAPPLVGTPPPSPPRRHHRLAWSLAASVVLALVAGVAVVVVQYRRDSDRFDAAHAAYLAGDCVAAVEGYDRLLGSARLGDVATVLAQARRERAECRELLAADAMVVTKGGAALTMYADFVDAHPLSPLADGIDERVQTLFRDGDSQSIASEANCDSIDGFVARGMLTGDGLPTLQVWCALRYEAVGRDQDSFETAMAVLESDAADTLRQSADVVAQRSDAACSNVDAFLAVSTVDLDDDALAAFLQHCMTVTEAAGDSRALALLQLSFLSELPYHPEAPAVEAAVLGNAASCEFLERMTTDPMLRHREGFPANATFTCAQVAEYLGDVDAAIERYQQFLDEQPLDPRVTAARDGLARSLVAQARTGRSTDLGSAPHTGSSGTSLARVVFSNDSPSDLQVVLSGPESRVEILAGTVSSVIYPTPPDHCRHDGVSTLTLDVPAGRYDIAVLSTDGAVTPWTGTWVLTSGYRYEQVFCVYAGSD